MEWTRGVTRHLSHETRHKTEYTRVRRDEIFILFFFKSSIMKYIGKNSILFNWKTQNVFVQVHFEMYFMKLNFNFN